MSDEIDLTHFPDNTKQELLGLATRSIASSLPIAGGFAGTLADALFPELTTNHTSFGWVVVVPQM
jgi:hypothetical protein